MSQVVLIPCARSTFSADCQRCKKHIGGGEEYIVASRIIYHRHCYYKSLAPESKKNPAEKEAHELILGAINRMLRGPYSRETKEHLRRLAGRHKHFLD